MDNGSRARRRVHTRLGGVLLVALAPAALAGQAPVPPHDEAAAGAEGRAGLAADERAVLDAAQALLHVINARDGAAARDLMVADGALVRIVVTGDGEHAQTIPNAEFVRTIGQPGPALLERMWEPRVLIHGPVATVWARYDFHVDGAFSHCGLNAFSLVRWDGAWKVAGVVYSVEREDCPASPLGPPA